MIVSAAKILEGIEPEKERTYPAKRRSWTLPAEPCLNAYRGCKGNTKEKYAGNGHCRNCYNRNLKHGDSWYHKPNMDRCRRPDCFMRGTEGHP